MIDITPSAADGIIQDEMAVHYCGHYVLEQFNTDLYNGNGCYIDRNNINNVTVSNQDSNTWVPTVCKKNIKSQQNGFEYKDNGVPLEYYRIANPCKPGVKGKSIELYEPNKRKMIVSGCLSGCGFAVLVSDQKVHVIHAGASSDSGQPVGKNRKLLINRDIYLMALALKDLERYPSSIDLSTQEKENGITKEDLFVHISRMGMKGCIYVSDAQRMIINNTDHSLILKTYQIEDKWYERQIQTGTDIYAFAYDAVCMINDRGKMALIFRKTYLLERRVVDGCLQYLW